MKLLFVSNLFPDASEPLRGIYNARLLAHLARHGEIRVLSPRPTLPLCAAPPRRSRTEDSALNPEFPAVGYLPKIGSRWNHRLMARGLRDPLERVRRAFPFDVVLVSWAYPDGCAVARLARSFRFPFAAVAQGTDIHQYLRNPVRRRIILEELAHAGAVIARSGELARLLRKAGFPAGQLEVIHNGVDLDDFRPGDLRQTRQELGLPDETAIILFVGNFLPVKNPVRLLTAFAQLGNRLPNRQTRLVMIGDGPLLAAARQQAQHDGLGERVSFVGRKDPAQVARYLQSADVLCVPSDNEGVPNVILEAFACGLPVVATRVGGIPEIVTGDFLGRLVPPGDTGALADALASQLGEARQTDAIRQYARRFSWEQTAANYLAVLQRTMRGRP